MQEQQHQSASENDIKKSKQVKIKNEDFSKSKLHYPFVSSSFSGRKQNLQSENEGVDDSPEKYAQNKCFSDKQGPQHSTQLQINTNPDPLNRFPSGATNQPDSKLGAMHSPQPTSHPGSRLGIHSQSSFGSQGLPGSPGVGSPGRGPVVGLSVPGIQRNNRSMSPDPSRKHLAVDTADDETLNGPTSTITDDLRKQLDESFRSGEAKQTNGPRTNARRRPSQTPAGSPDHKSQAEVKSALEGLDELLSAGEMKVANLTSPEKRNSYKPSNRREQSSFTGSRAVQRRGSMQRDRIQSSNFWENDSDEGNASADEGAPRERKGSIIRDRYRSMSDSGELELEDESLQVLVQEQQSSPGPDKPKAKNGLDSSPSGHPSPAGDDLALKSHLKKQGDRSRVSSMARKSSPQSSPTRGESPKRRPSLTWNGSNAPPTFTLKEVEAQDEPKGNESPPRKAGRRPSLIWKGGEGAKVEYKDEEKQVMEATVKTESKASPGRRRRPSLILTNKDKANPDFQVLDTARVPKKKDSDPPSTPKKKPGRPGTLNYLDGTDDGSDDDTYVPKAKVNPSPRWDVPADKKSHRRRRTGSKQQASPGREKSDLDTPSRRKILWGPDQATVLDQEDKTVPSNRPRKYSIHTVSCGPAWPTEIEGSSQSLSNLRPHIKDVWCSWGVEPALLKIVSGREFQEKIRPSRPHVVAGFLPQELSLTFSKDVNLCLLELKTAQALQVALFANSIKDEDGKIIEVPQSNGQQCIRINMAEDSGYKKLDRIKIRINSAHEDFVTLFQLSLFGIVL